MVRSKPLFRARTILMVSALLVAQLAPAVVMAGESEESQDRAQKRMLALNEEGFAAFADEEFGEAARKFEEAHTYVADPILRKNAAIAWFKAGNCDKASEAALFFLLADEMSVKDRVEARSVLGHCRLEEAEKAIEAGESKRARAIVERVAFLQTDERVDQRLSALRMQLEAGPGGKTLTPKTTAGWTLVATGAAVLAGTVGYHILSANDQDQLADLRASGHSPGRRQELQDSVDTAGWLVPALYTVGSVSTGTGLWLVLSDDDRGQETAKPAAQKAPAPAVQIGMSFEF